MTTLVDCDSFNIRLFRPDVVADRSGVREIFDLTGLFGDPVARYFPAPGFIADAMVEYYMQFEQDWLLIAEDKATGQVAGYILGCPDTSARERRSVTWLLPRLLASLFRNGLLFSGALWRMALAGLRDQIGERLAGQRGASADLRRYPAHLHMAVHPRFHRRGIGGALLNALCERLAAAGIPGIHLHTTSRHEAAIAMYRKNGFRAVASSRTTMFNHLVPQAMLPIDNIVMVRDLVSPPAG